MKYFRTSTKDQICDLRVDKSEVGYLTPSGLRESLELGVLWAGVTSNRQVWYSLNPPLKTWYTYSVITEQEGKL